VLYSDKPCSHTARASMVNASPNTLDRSGARLQEQHEAALHERERAYWRAEHERQASSAQATYSQAQSEKSKREQFRNATTPLPGSQGGLTKSQREAAAGLARTQQEKSELMREAMTPLPGSRGGLTASQMESATHGGSVRITSQSTGRKQDLSATDNHPANSHPSGIPIPIVACDPGGCSDPEGRRYIRAGPHGFTRTDGKFCTRAGPNAICH
jgi:hypothetical protein